MRARTLRGLAPLLLIVPVFAGEPVPEEATPARVTVQHILIGALDSVPGMEIDRTPREARLLAHELLERARAGEEFDVLVREYSDDDPPGIYRITNFGVEPTEGERARARMMKSFGDVSFSLKVGEIGIADWHPENSRYGWHIIKRVE